MSLTVLTLLFAAAGQPDAAESGDVANAFDVATETLRFSFDDSEDLNDNGILDDGEDVNGNGILDLGEDQDVDHLPDDWVRRRGPGFPKYVRCMIDREHGHTGDQSLHCAINGGRMTYYSPFNNQAGRIDPTFNYVFRGFVRTDGLKHDAAVLSVSFLNARRQRVQCFRTTAVSGTHSEWVPLKLGPLEPLPEVRFVVIGCHVVHGEDQDIHGDVWFDSLWMGRLPRLTLINDPQDHYLTPNGLLWQRRVPKSSTGRRDVSPPSGETNSQRKPLVAQVTGLEPGFDYTLFMSLRDVTGKVLEQRTWRLTADDISSDSTDQVSSSIVRWDVTPRESGCYFVRAHLKRGVGRILLRETTIAVVDPARSRTTGEFGWSLTSGYGKLEPDDVINLLSEAGVNTVKLPLWRSMHGEGNATSVDLATVLEGLSNRSIGVVGLLNDPPSSIRDLFGDRYSGSRQIFDLDREFWGPSLEPVLARYGSTVEFWQLGGEDDHSFVGWAKLPLAVQAIRSDFDRIGRNSQIGVQWPWPSDEQPIPTDIRDLFVTVGGPDGLDASDMDNVFMAEKSGPTKRWALIRPMSVSAEPQHDVRAADLVNRMVAARLAGARRIFLSDPLDEEHGVLYRDGAPAPLFLPWRTAALLLRGTRHLGSFNLPGNPVNHVFERDGEVTVIFAAAQPATVALNLGDKVEEVDIWGSRQDVEKTDGKHQIRVRPQPVFYTGCLEPLARWRLETGFENGRIPSVLGQHRDAIIVHNTFKQGVRGTVRITVPNDWELERDHWTIELAAGESTRLPVEITLPATESLGTANAVLSFDVESDRRRQFDVYRSFEVGLGDILVDLFTRPLADGRLEIEQIVINKTNGDPMSFKCTLSVAGHRSQATYVTRLGRDQDRKLYYLPNAAALRGRELWLNLEEIGGRRNLNKRMIIGEDWPATR